ncbi:sulfurtransferase-like selenium metabolism protein YedF [Sedimentibacter sp. zth1]|uniref:sulfurtransferase-like selenium metabolism protein YedF n=1 Tax=Sedimentibacter sp. zth1 TaxID=2816908 RepID=UPI001A92AACA|nr:sulfurtransferase-like selenium metabolism protein YedF [Sedimentibacter sp. zth1]QSX05197.1 sulfurtransferase-like selenium metabolism protein YedF [Sedimentibacter sp. zth1]
MKIINAEKLNCPQPLILTKNALEEENNIQIIVDNEIASQNIIKFCKKMNFKFNIEEKENKFYINITKENNNTKCDVENKTNSKIDINNKVYFIESDKLGSGSDELGKLLMKGFIYTITQVKPYPEHIIFLNSGVKIACENSDSIDDLNKLIQCGTKIVSCGTCLDYYQLTKKLKVGEISNMYDIVEIISSSNDVITIG